jgi:hypothetical protein
MENQGCYPACVRLPYSFSIRDDRDLLEIVGRMCGDDVHDLLKQRLQEQPMSVERKRLADLMERISEAADEISMAVASIERAASMTCNEFVEVKNYA